MDSALALNAIREYDQRGNYDAIVYDGTGGLETLRMLGIPEVLSWYGRRFRQVFSDSDLGKVLSPFLQPVTSAIFNVSWSTDDLTQQPTKEAADILEQGKAALANPDRVAAYLVTTEAAMAVATAKYLWSSAQQVGLTVKGVLLNQAEATAALADEFSPLPLTAFPTQAGGDWQPLIDALPDLRAASSVPQPVTINLQERQVRVFLPRFAKNQVKLTQYGPEITIDAGDQRRNIDLPAALRGQPVKGAKFQGGYLIISF
jgi:arsenite-transporting ATPase